MNADIKSKYHIIKHARQQNTLRLDLSNMPSCHSLARIPSDKIRYDRESVITKQNTVVHNIINTL